MSLGTALTQVMGNEEITGMYRKAEVRWGVPLKEIHQWQSGNGIFIFCI